MTAPRRRFRFSLRTMFVLLTILIAPLAWLTVQVKWIRDRHDAQFWIRCDWSGQNDPRAIPFLPHRTYFLICDAPWSLRLLGETGMQRIELNGNPKPGAPYTRTQLEALFPEAEFVVVPGGK